MRAKITSSLPNICFLLNGTDFMTGDQARAINAKHANRYAWERDPAEAARRRLDVQVFEKKKHPLNQPTKVYPSINQRTNTSQNG